METIRPRILCVDDEPMMLDALARTLRQQFVIVTAASGDAGLRTVAEEAPFAVVVSDMRMPEMDGATFLRHVRERASDTVRILLTGQTEIEVAIAAVNDGNIFRFLTKPCPPEVLVPALHAAAEQHRLITSERVLLEQTLRGSIKALTDVLSLVNPAAFGRANRVKQHVARIGASHPDAGDCWQLEVAAMLSQIGCVTLPSQTAEKLYHGRPLSRAEMEMTGRLAGTAARLLANIPRLERVRDVLTYQDKHFDGTGPPADGVRGTRIPWGARVLKVALDYDALETQAVPPREALDTLRCRKGVYDPEVLQAFAEMLGHVDGGGKVREMRLLEARPGMVFADDVVSRTGMLLIARGQEVTSGLLDRIRNFSDDVGVREPVRMMIGAIAPLESTIAAHAS